MEEPRLDDVLSPSWLAYILDGARRPQGTLWEGCAPHGGAPPMSFLQVASLIYSMGAGDPKGPSGRVAHPMEEPPLDDVQDPPNYQHTENHEEIEAGTLHQGVWIAQKAPDPGSRLDIYKAHGEDKTRQITNIPKIMRKSRLAPSIGESAIAPWPQTLVAA